MKIDRYILYKNKYRVRTGYGLRVKNLRKCEMFFGRNAH